MRAEKLFKLLQKMIRNKHKADEHSFTAFTENDRHLFVEARETSDIVIVLDGNVDFTGNAIQCCNRLERILKIDFDTIEF